ncbi:DUF4331 family protein [Cryptosporangium arvum]|uniref:DUF4331 domain-containing protein n=1 Tax=Cryptosporangium arvum DSM 44712 TaxID=927661 RepID=A0A010ZTM4_9ACTN|nr:DUF4331 family protein [Cryptosporangium arvum]EXG82054.1 hypothetical protein CryarDRAFT_3187 [Cryptosporangium arvum DSM 44712]
MSHHLDSPLSRRDPRLNITDQYLFDDRDGTVFVLNTRTSLAGDTAPTGFHEEGRYEFRIHLDGAEIENLTFRFAFDEEGNGLQPYRLCRLEGDDAADDGATGTEILYGHTDRTSDSPDGIQAWAGRALDPFYLDLGQLDLVNRLILRGADSDPTEYKAVNTFAGATVQSIVLRVPHRDRALFAERDIRVWSTTRLATDAGGWRQIGRAGLPTRPEAYADRVVDRIMPDTLPYRVGSPATFGFSVFNGRHLADNAPEVMFSLAMNSAISTGLAPASAVETRSPRFPFVVPAGDASRRRDG